MGRIIKRKLKEDEERSVSWLARQINCDPCNLCRILKNSQHINSELLVHISRVLRYDFFKYYSIFLHKNNYVDENDSVSM